MYLLFSRSLCSTRSLTPGCPLSCAPSPSWLTLYGGTVLYPDYILDGIKTVVTMLIVFINIVYFCYILHTIRISLKMYEKKGAGILGQFIERMEGAMQGAMQDTGGGENRSQIRTRWRQQEAEQRTVSSALSTTTAASSTSLHGSFASSASIALAGFAVRLGWKEGDSWGLGKGDADDGAENEGGLEMTLNALRRTEESMTTSVRSPLGTPAIPVVGRQGKSSTKGEKKSERDGIGNKGKKKRRNGKDGNEDGKGDENHGGSRQEVAIMMPPPLPSRKSFASPLPPALPPGWEEHTTEGGDAYYHNSKLGTTQWNRPT